ncbi:MAG: class I SAM-dependent methyltransferase [Planctomycetota bacterium]
MSASNEPSSNEPSQESSLQPLAYHAYQQLADSYAARIDTKPHNAYYERPAMLDLLPDVDGKRVLDAGCGPGAYSAALVKRGAVVDGIDVSDRMLELANERLGNMIDRQQVRLHRVDMTQPLTIFENATFEVVNAPLCLDYIEDWTSLFREFCRVLKPGGHFQFSCGHPAFDADYFNTRNYFSVEQVECNWTGFDIPIRMPSFRRSLTEAINPVIEAGFLLKKVIEPTPTEDFRQADPRRFKILMHRPCFICVSATKA